MRGLRLASSSPHRATHLWNFVATEEWNGMVLEDASAGLLPDACQSERHALESDFAGKGQGRMTDSVGLV